ncbi:MAG: metal-dependent hydrolase [Candidatus Latescibacteria bacterium]|nr:metal-dependent hydrolase [Candidatus Latescibacterota bacterium]
MDTPTHGLVGRLVARSIWPGRDSRGLVNTITVASMLPDLDVLIRGDALERLQTHRGLSHSLVGAAVGALIVAWVAKRFGCRRETFSTVYGAALLGLMLHIAFDYVTSYGTMIFEPFSNYRASLDVLFIIDPYLDLVLITGLLLGWRVMAHPALGYRIGAVALAAYMALNLGALGIGHHQAARWAAEKGIAAEEIAVLPVPFSPLHRLAIVRAGGQVHRAPLYVMSGVNGEHETYPFAPADRRLPRFWDTRSGRIYRWFARFPVIVPSQGDERDDLLIQDLRFSFRPDALGWLGSWAAEAAVDHNPEFFKRSPFTLRVRLDGEGRVERVIYRGGAIDQADSG